MPALRALHHSVTKDQQRILLWISKWKEPLVAVNKVVLVLVQGLNPGKLNEIRINTAPRCFFFNKSLAWIYSINFFCHIIKPLALFRRERQPLARTVLSKRNKKSVGWTYFARAIKSKTTRNHTSDNKIGRPRSGSPICLSRVSLQTELDETYPCILLGVLMCESDCLCESWKEILIVRVIWNEQCNRGCCS